MVVKKDENRKQITLLFLGNDEDSQRMNEIWEKETIKSFCQTHCVCLKLANDRYTLMLCSLFGFSDF